MARMNGLGWIPAVTALALIAACSESPAPAKTPAKHAASLSPEADAMRRMAVGVPVGTGTADVEVRFDLPAAPVPGQAFDLDVAVLTKTAAPAMRVDVSAGDGLVLTAPASTVSFDKPQPGTMEHVAVKGSSTQAGTRLVNVKVTLDIPTGVETREFAFPVLVGAAPAAGAAAPPKG